MNIHVSHKHKSTKILKSIHELVNNEICENVCPICLEQITNDDINNLIIFNCSCSYYYHNTCVNKLCVCPICRAHTRKTKLIKNTITPHAVLLYRKVKRYYEIHNYVNDTNYIQIIRRLIQKYKYSISTHTISCDIKLLCIDSSTQISYNFGGKLGIGLNGVDDTENVSIKSKTPTIRNKLSVTINTSQLLSSINKYTYGLIELINCSDNGLSNIYFYGLRLMITKLICNLSQTNQTTQTKLKKYLNFLPIDIRIYGDEKRHLNTLNLLIDKLRSVYSESNIYFTNSRLYTIIYIKTLDTRIRIDNCIFENINDLHLNNLNSLKKIFVKTHDYECYSLPDFNYCFYNRKCAIQINHDTNKIDDLLLEDIMTYTINGFDIYVSNNLYNLATQYGIHITDLNKLYDYNSYAFTCYNQHSCEQLNTHIINPHKVHYEKLNIKSMCVNDTYDILTFIENINITDIYGSNFNVVKYYKNNDEYIINNSMSYIIEITTGIEFLNNHHNFCSFINMSLKRFSTTHAKNKEYDFIDQFTYNTEQRMLQLIVCTTSLLDECDVHKIKVCIIKTKNVQSHAIIAYYYDN